MNELFFNLFGVLLGMSGVPNPDLTELAATWQLVGTGASDGIIVGNGRELDGAIVRADELASSSATTGVALDGVRVVRGRLVR